MPQAYTSETKSWLAAQRLARSVGSSFWSRCVRGQGTPAKGNPAKLYMVGGSLAEVTPQGYAVTEWHKLYD